MSEAILNDITEFFDYPLRYKFTGSLFVRSFRKPVRVQIPSKGNLLSLPTRDKKSS